MTKVIAAGCACVTFAGFQAHGSLATVRKTLEFDRRKCGACDEKAQSETYENKRQWSHGKFLEAEASGASLGAAISAMAIRITAA
jgi:hypothetical protein